jgi:hypothetical protein
MRSLSSQSASSSWFEGEVVGAVEVGGAIDVAGAGSFKIAVVLLGANVLRAFEHHVLEKMGEAGATRTLIGGSDVIPQVDGDQRQPVILDEDDLQTVLQRVLLKLDLGRGHGGGPTDSAPSCQKRKEGKDANALRGSKQLLHGGLLRKDRMRS